MESNPQQTMRIGVSMPQKHENSVSVLAIGDFANDRALLQDISRLAGWQLIEARDRRRAMQYLERQRVQVVIAESELPNWDWKKVLSDIRRLAEPPQLIVTSRTADDYLWAEVLNIGGYDVLPQPLERDEVERVVAAATRQYSRPLRLPVQSSLAPAVAHSRPA
jgi:DNA-binding response OmpR family regulator